MLVGSLIRRVGTAAIALGQSPGQRHVPDDRLLAQALRGAPAIVLGGAENEARLLYVAPVSTFDTW